MSDGWLFGLWVVGSSRIRAVDATWPAPGAKIHHSVGVWPTLIDDNTECLDWVPDQRMRLRARGWPAGEAEVVLNMSERPDGCRVSITEDAVKGPGKFIPKPVRVPLIHWRNTESLRRLDYLAVGRTSGTSDRRPLTPTSEPTEGTTP